MDYIKLNCRHSNSVVFCLFLMLFISKGHRDGVPMIHTTEDMKKKAREIISNNIKYDIE